MEVKTTKPKSRTRRDGTVPHGLGGYTNYRCRCPVCKDARDAYFEQWVLRRVLKRMSA